MSSSYSGREAWFSSPGVKWNAKEQLERAVDPGIRRSGMPGSKDILSEDEILSIVVFLRYLPPPGTLGKPEMYSH